MNIIIHKTILTSYSECRWIYIACNHVKKTEGYDFDIDAGEE